MKNKSLYAINWKEGARGSFIGDLVVLLLTNNTHTIIPVKPIYGDGGGLSRPQIINDSYDLILGYPINPSGLVDYDTLNNDYKQWKILWIAHTEEELLQVELINMYKKECIHTSPNWYIPFYKDNASLHVDGIDNPYLLPTPEFRKFVDAYMNHIRKTNRQFISNVFDDLYKNLPDIIKQNIIKINFIDITTNMPKVLDILSKFTGKEITPNVVESYKKYLLHQNLPQRYLDILYNK